MIWDEDSATDLWMDEGTPGPKPRSMRQLHVQIDRAEEIEAAEERANEALSESTNPDELWERVRN